MTVRLICLLMAATAVVAAGPLDDLLRRPDAWFTSAEGRTAIANMLSWQAPAGSWPKNRDHSAQPFGGDRAELQGTFDNGATTRELRVLARAFQATSDPACQQAFLAGFDHILTAQYPNGGWPQQFPPGPQYHRHITFNDYCMTRLLEFLRDAAGDTGRGLLDDRRRAAARDAVSRGIGCILKCQVRVRGELTVWCAQHDEATLAPAPARSYELPSLSGAESAGILRLLMSLDEPSPEVVRAVEAGVAWFAAVKLEGIRIVAKDGDRVVVPDPSAPPLWARFYDLATGKPFFCDRDGVKKATLAEIGKERRNGYSWYGNWGEGVAQEYARWPHRLARPRPESGR
jgi:pectate lyase